MIKTLSHTKHRDKKIPPSVNLLCEATRLKPDFQGKVSPEELKAFMKKFAYEGKLPKYGVPDRYVFMDHIPKTSVGKLDKKVLRTSVK